MKQLTCDICGSNELVKQDGYFVCQYCQTKYSVEEAKNMMIEGTVDVKGTVKIDNSSLIEKYLSNARRALKKDDWEEVEKYYNLVEANSPTNIEALFFSSFGKAMLSLTDSEYYKRQQKFDVLTKSMSVISDYYEETDEDKQAILTQINEYIKKMYTITFVFNINAGHNYVGGKGWCINLFNNVKTTFVRELNEIAAKHNDEWIQELIRQNQVAKSGCYIATSVYGSYNCPEVWTLRRFRDYTLAESWYGRLFILIYYSISPTLVKVFGNSLWFKKLWHIVLSRMIKNLRSKGFESTPYNDFNWKIR
jgi:uncharacterized Zn finger protein (UPF0148 family)